MMIYYFCLEFYNISISYSVLPFILVYVLEFLHIFIFNVLSKV